MRRAEGIGNRTGRRPTIGCVNPSVEGDYGLEVWGGALDVLREREGNLICFVGRALAHPGQPEAHENVIYELVGPGRVDGLIVSSGELGHLLRQEDVASFCRRFRPLPVVSVGLALGDIPSVTVDNRAGVMEAMHHLVEVHGYRRIAFIRGPEGSEGARVRYLAYVEALEELGIDFDPDLVLPGRFTRQSGAEAVRVLLDERGVRPEAIFAADDSMAAGALEALHERGIRVPQEIALVGFDDFAESANLMPPLTTVRQPVYEMGRQAAEMLLARLRGERVAGRVTLPARLVVRQSCGCVLREVAQVDVGTVRPAGEPLAAGWPAVRERVLAAMESSFEVREPWPGRVATERLLDAFAAELLQDQRGSFLAALEEELYRPPEGGIDIHPWLALLALLRQHSLPYLVGDSAALVRADALWDQAQVLVGEVGRRLEAARRLRMDSYAALMRRVGQQLIATFDIEQLMDVVAQELPGLGVQGAYVALYEEEPRLPSRWSRLVLGFSGEHRHDVGAEGRLFLSQRLLPDELWPADRTYSMVVKPLRFGAEQLGFVVFEADPEVGRACEALARQISSALRGALLLQERERSAAELSQRALQLQTAAEVARVAGSLLDPEELVVRAVNLIRDRFDLYYVGLFLVDERGEWTDTPGRWAVLRAGTGEAGRLMLLRGHKLEVGGASMIGQCVARGEARIALDVGEEAVRFDNPLLPDTRSELALPLISRGRVIGALTIQSVQEAAFSEADITVLQLMADQLANAIQNARLFADLQESAQRVRSLYEITRALSSTLDEEELMRFILDSIYRQMGCEYVIVSLVDEEAGMMESRHGIWRGEYDAFPEWIQMARYSLDEPDILVDVYHSGRTEIISGWDDRFNREIYERFGHERLLRIFMPIRARGKTIGVVEVGYDRYEKGRVEGEEVELLAAFVDQAAVALENARLFREARMRTEELAVLNEVSRKLAAHISIHEMMETVYQGASRLLDAANFFVALYDPDRDELQFVFDASEEEQDRFQVLPADRGLVGYIVRNRTSVLIKDDLLRRLAEMGIETVGVPAQSWLGVPIVLGDQVLGVMGVQHYDRPYAYTERDRDLLGSLAGQLAIALQSARLFEEVQARAERERLIREVSDQMQRAVDLESLMRITAEGLRRALKGSRAYVYMGTADVASDGVVNDRLGKGGV